MNHTAARMLEAMAQAEVGDDVYGEDPTVNKLEERGAEFLGKEASLFVPSGTMANLLALACHTQRLDEVICGNESHIFHWEAGNASALFGIAVNPVQTAANGELPLPALRAAKRPNDVHCSRSRVVAVENTHNMRGGTVLSEEYLTDLRRWCDASDMILHMDGARLANAAVATGLSAQRIAAPVHSVTLCLSKGLSAPVGSLLAGSRDFILRARHVRKMLGGGMRQAGVIAAAGLCALEDYEDYVPRDHARAHNLAEGLKRIGFRVVHGGTNIVLFAGNPVAPDDANAAVAQMQKALKAHGILCGGVRSYSPFLRLVTHRHITEECVGRTLKALAAIGPAYFVRT